MRKYMGFWAVSRIASLLLINKNSKRTIQKYCDCNSLLSVIFSIICKFGLKMEYRIGSGKKHSKENKKNNNKNS
jgi:hypothetical protein